MPRVLLLLPTTTYRTEAFVGAASRLGVDVTVASEQPNTLTRLNPAGLLTLDFKDPQEAAQRVVEFSTSHPIDAVVPVDSQVVVVVGAAISAALGLRHNSGNRSRVVNWYRGIWPIDVDFGHDGRIDARMQELR